MAKYEIGGKRPKIAESTFVHEAAIIIGDVEIGEGCFIGAGAVLRGDWGMIRVGNRTSVQENCVLHSRPGETCSVGSDITIGHGAVLHGCKIEDRALVGMHATVSDGSVVGEDALVAEGSVVRSRMQIPPRMLVAGCPAEIKGELKENQILHKNAGAQGYAAVVSKYKTDLKRID